MDAATLLLAPVLLASLDGEPVGGGACYQGEAHDLATEELVYVEEHCERPGGERVVYRAADGTVLVDKWIVHGEHPSAPAFESVDRRTGERHAARPAGNRIELAHLDGDGERPRRRVVDLPAEAVVDAGFDAYLRANWDRLVAGETLRLAFAVPSRLTFVSFRARRVDDGGAETRRVTFELAPDSAWLRFLVEPIRVTYDARQRRLLEYVGLTNIAASDGEAHKARVVFRYADGSANERKRGDRVAGSR